MLPSQIRASRSHESCRMAAVIGKAMPEPFSIMPQVHVNVELTGDNFVMKPLPGVGPINPSVSGLTFTASRFAHGF
jgi:hypothetical protein